MLRKVLQAELGPGAAPEPPVQVRFTAPLLLPESPPTAYRAVRRLLATARRMPGVQRVRLTILDRPGRAQVEVVATAVLERSAAVFSCAFDRHATGTLDGGFFEGVETAP